MTQKDELAKLKARVEELERAAKPPEPFKPEPYQRYDPTAGMSMPRSVMEEMARAVPDRVMKEVALRDARAPTGRPGVIPNSQQPTSPSPSAGDGTGWAREIPIGPSVHQRYVDAQLDAQDARDKAERIRQDAQLQAMQKLAEGKS
jgi:hypothetical protein